MASDTLRRLFVIDTSSSSEITINNNDRGVFTFSLAKTGFIPVGIVGIALANNWMFVGGFSIDYSNNTATVIIHNRSGSSGAQTVTATVLYRPA